MGHELRESGTCLAGWLGNSPAATNREALQSLVPSVRPTVNIQAKPSTQLPRKSDKSHKRPDAEAARPTAKTSSMNSHVPHDLIERLMSNRLYSPFRRSFSPLLVPLEIEAQRLQAADEDEEADASSITGSDIISAACDSSAAGPAGVSEAVSEDDEGQHCYTLVPGFTIYIDSPCRQRYAASDDGSDESDESDEDNSPAARRWILGEVNEQRRLGPEPRG